MEKSKIRFKIKNFACLTARQEFCIVILIVTFCVLNFMGCAGLTEGVKGIAGISTKSLEEGRKDAIVKDFNYDYFTCYTKTLDILKELGAYIYTQNIKKRLIAIYVSEQDTTPVGLFFKEIDRANTQIEVSSPSTYAKELISTRVFSALEKPEQK